MRDWYLHWLSSFSSLLKEVMLTITSTRFVSDIYQTPSMVISVLVLFSGYLTRLIKLFESASVFTKLWIRTKPGRVLKRALKNSINDGGSHRVGKSWKLKYLALEMLYVILLACFEIFESVLWEASAQR